MSKYTRIMVTKEQSDFIEKNFLEIGGAACGKILGLKKATVFSRANKLGLKISKERISEIRKSAALELNKEKTQPLLDAFLKINTPEKAYLLGYFWADGHLSKNEIRMTILSSDMLTVQQVFSSTGGWNFIPVPNHDYIINPLTRISACNQRLCDRFSEMGYKTKSFSGLEKVLSFIPENFHNYFIRGLFDGDGCISYNGTRQNLTICSTFLFDWTPLKELFLKLNIHFNVSYKTNKRGHCSIFEIRRKLDIYKFYKYIYSGNPFGLSRKHNIFVDIFTRKMKRNLKKNSFMLTFSDSYWL